MDRLRKLLSQSSLLRIYPLVGLLLIFLGPYFLFQSLSFLRHLNYVAAILAFFAGWTLLRAGVDLTRTALIAPTSSPRENSNE
jgi:positive regulator of sigma E activity